MKIKNSQRTWQIHLPPTGEPQVTADCVLLKASDVHKHNRWSETSVCPESLSSVSPLLHIERSQLRWFIWLGRGMSGFPCWTCWFWDPTSDKRKMMMDGYMIITIKHRPRLLGDLPWCTFPPSALFTLHIHIYIYIYPGNPAFLAGGFATLQLCFDVRGIDHFLLPCVCTVTVLALLELLIITLFLPIIYTFCIVNSIANLLYSNAHSYRS